MPADGKYSDQLIFIHFVCGSQKWRTSETNHWKGEIIYFKLLSVHGQLLHYFWIMVRAHQKSTLWPTFSSWTLSQGFQHLPKQHHWWETTFNMWVTNPQSMSYQFSVCELLTLNIWATNPKYELPTFSRRVTNPQSMSCQPSIFEISTFSIWATSLQYMRPSGHCRPKP